MTIGWFLRAFKELLTQGWKVRKVDGEIRLRPPKEMMPKDTIEQYCDCPITAIWRQRIFDGGGEGAKAKAIAAPTYEEHPPAARNLGLKLSLRNRITDASDYDFRTLAFRNGGSPASEAITKKMMLRLDLLRVATLPIDRDGRNQLPQKVKKRLQTLVA